MERYGGAKRASRSCGSLSPAPACCPPWLRGYISTSSEKVAGIVTVQTPTNMNSLHITELQSSFGVEVAITPGLMCSSSTSIVWMTSRTS